MAAPQPPLYGVLHCNDGAAAYARSLGIALYEGYGDGYRVRLCADQHAQLLAEPADFTLAVYARADDAGRTPIVEMQPEQLRAEIAYCDWAIAAAIPFTPAMTTDAYLVRHGVTVAAPGPGPSDLFAVREAARQALAQARRACAPAPGRLEPGA